MRSDPPRLLTARGVGFDFGTTKVLDGIDLELQAGEFVAITGPSGCGKSVFLRCLAGLLTPTRGQMTPVRSTIALQRAPLFPWLTIEDNLALCLENKESIKTRRHLAIEQLKSIGLQRFNKKFPSEISGGMRQKLNVLRAFLSSAPLVLMDEPFVSLDETSRIDLHEFTLEQWSAQKKSVVLVTHQLDEAITLASRVLVFSPSPSTVTADLRFHDFSVSRSGSSLTTDAYQANLAKLRVALGIEARAGL